MTKGAAWVLLVAMTGCGGTVSAGVSPATSSGVENLPEAACLERATAQRAKRPDEPDRITVSHLLVKHAGVENAEGTTRSRGEACLRAEAARDKLRGGAEWDAIVAEFSDEKGAASRAGSVGEATREMLVPTFADAAFELDIQQLSDVVESKFGFHVILRTQ